MLLRNHKKIKSENHVTEDWVDLTWEEEWGTKSGGLDEYLPMS